MNYSILRCCAFVLGACLLLSASAADARPPRARADIDGGRSAQRWQAAAGLGRILVQGRMSDAQREQLRRDLSATPRDRGRDARRDSRMTPQQRESLRRDMRDANRQLDRDPRRGNGGKRGGNGERGRERR